MLGSCLRALARGRLVAAGREAQLQQLRFLNLHEYQACPCLTCNSRSITKLITDVEMRIQLYGSIVPCITVKQPCQEPGICHMR